MLLSLCVLLSLAESPSLSMAKVDPYENGAPVSVELLLLSKPERLSASVLLQARGIYQLNCGYHKWTYFCQKITGHKI